MKDEMLLQAEQLAFEKFMEGNFRDLIDRRHVKNGDGGYFAWDMVVAWIVWQGRAALQSANSAQPVTVPAGYVLVPVEPTPEMCDVGHIGIDVLTGVTSDSEYYSTWGDSAAKLYRAMLAAAPKAPDGWIPVSERMPEKDGNYWGWWSESKRQGPAWFIKSELQAQFQSSEITHWRTLPDAPKVTP